MTSEPIGCDKEDCALCEDARASTAIKPHTWELSYGHIDLFAAELGGEGFCNGPQCARCGRNTCHHCEPDLWDEECPAA